MTALTIMLGPHRYALHADTSPRQLESRIVAAMRRGAGVVSLPLATGGTVDVVVTPHLPVLLERAQPSLEVQTGAEPAIDWPSFDLEDE